MTGRGAAAVLCAFLGAQAAAPSAFAGEPGGALPAPREFFASALAGCGNFLAEGSGRAGGCLLERALPFTADYLEGKGREAFGRRFGVTESLSFDGGGLRGDIDVVLPLAGGGDPFLDGDGAFAGVGGALFLQTGASGWRDREGMMRHDLRAGLVRRFRAPGGDGGGLLGFSVFGQRNLERGHSRGVLGVDYARAGTEVALNRYLPTTGWLPGSPGREERALEGTELSGKVALAPSLGLEGSLSRWRVPGLPGRSDSRKVGLRWAHNRWVDVALDWQDDRATRLPEDLRVVDERSHDVSIGVRVRIPVGAGSPATPPSLGAVLRRTRKGRGPGPLEGLWEKAWRPARHDGRIRYATREVARAGVAAAAGPSVEFAQDSAVSGGSVRLLVTLPEAAVRDLRYSVVLVPGDGDNPAVRGEDFSAEPVAVLIPRGETSVTVDVPLLPNPGMRAPRSLSARLVPHASDPAAARPR